MIARITGTLEAIEHNSALITQTLGEHASITREILLPAYLAARLLDRVGGPITLHTVESLEPHGQGGAMTPRLIGFASAEDKRFFAVFTTVKGVGARRALRALARPAGEVASMIEQRDAKELTKLPEIGKRLAETIIAELHGKIDAFVLGPQPGAGAERPASQIEAGALGSEAARQAVAALVRLGERDDAARELIERTLDGHPDLESPDELVARALSAR